MMNKEEDWNKEIENEEKQIDNEFEALSETRKIYSKTPLTSDHVVAHLNEAEKELISETIFNSDFAHNILMRYANEKCIAQWNKEKMKWEQNTDGSIKYFSISEIDQDGKKKIEENAKRILAMFMLKINAIAILNRNTEKNFMLKYGWFKNREEEKPIQYGEDDRSMLRKAIDKIQGVEYEE